MSTMEMRLKALGVNSADVSGITRAPESPGVGGSPSVPSVRDEVRHKRAVGF